MTDAERAELRKKNIIPFFTGSPSKPTWFYECRDCGLSWPDGQPEAHAPGCQLKETEAL